MKRSGHHALVNWIGRNDGDCIHQNDVQAKPDLSDFKGSSKVFFGDFAFGPQAEQKNLIANFEDFDFSLFDKIKWPKDGNVYHILFMRDFPNWLASCYKRKDGSYGRDVYDNLLSRIELYRSQAKIFSSQDARIVPVSYNLFLTSHMYRNELASILGFKNGDGEQGLSRVTQYGYGSSFTGMQEQVIKTEDVFSRYKEFDDDMAYQVMLKTNSDLVDFGTNFLGTKKG